MPPRITLVALLIALGLTCGGRALPTADVSSAGDGGTDVRGGALAAAPRPAAAIRFAPFTCVDEEGLGIPAFTMLVPAGWQVEGGVRWRTDNPAFPAFAALRVANPERLQELEVFPNLPMFWTDNQGLLGMFPVGTKYFGNTVHPPLEAAAALRQLVLPAFRGGVGGLEVLAAAGVPALAEAVQAMQAQAQPEAGIRADAARIRVAYTTAGTAIEEELYAVVQTFAYRVPTALGVTTNVSWWVDYVFSFKAERGRLDDAAALLQTVAFSLRPDARWFAGYSRLVEALIQGQIRQIRSIGEIGRRYAQAGSELREAELHRWEADQAVRDRLAEDWSRQFRGYEQYWDPAGERMVDLPIGYDNAWVNNLGEVVMSGDPSFDPNIGGNQHWQPMPRR